MNPHEQKTFTPPPLDGSILPHEILDFHFENSPDWTFAKWQIASGALRSLKFIEFARAIQQCSRDVAAHLSFDIDAGELPPLRKSRKNDSFSRPVVALLASGETFSYFAMVLGILRSGAVPFPLSINNSKEAVVHLLEATGASWVVENAAEDPPEIGEVLSQALEELQSRQKIGRIPYPDISRLLELDSSFQPLPRAPRRDPEEACLILHSSASTGSFPKPITSTLFTFLSVFNSLNCGDESMLGKVMNVGHLPNAHAMKIQWGSAMAMGCGMSLGWRDPFERKPASAETSLRELEALKPDFLLAVPTFYQTYAADPEMMKSLLGIRCITSGGPLPQEAAAILSNNGVQLWTALGSTECGLMSKFPSHHADAIQFEPNPQINMKFRSQSDTDISGEYEMLIAQNDRHRPNVLNDTYQGEKVYATSDLVRLTKTRDGNTLVQVVGRLDDQIMHATGEKTNPGPLQSIISMDPLVCGALYFGRERHQVGVLIEVSRVTDVEESSLDNLRDSVWPAVQKANDFAPSHSVVRKDMIIFSSPVKPFSRSAKGSIRSGYVLSQYTAEIDNLYQVAEQRATTAAQAPSEWTENSTHHFVARLVEEILETPNLDPTKDLFSIGCDSLKATKIRTIISKSLEPTSIRLSPEIVYDNPTISSLSSSLLKHVKGSDQPIDASSSNEIHQRAMRDMIRKYSSRWPARNISCTERVRNEVVLLTGSTGSLGAVILSQLIKRDSVSRIYALNRGSTSRSLKDRQLQAFADKGLNLELLRSEKLHLLEANLNEEGLGLKEADYLHMRESITLIIHNAWKLDFKLKLSSFEEHVKASRNLIDLALQSPRINPPKFVFTSSIASVANFKGRTVPEENFLDDLEVAVSGGYGESKAVVERILVNASLEAGLESCVVRIGQISGSKANGSWSTSDSIPLIIQAAEHLGCLPKMLPHQIVSWISPDDVSSTILDLGFQRLDGERTPPSSYDHFTPLSSTATKSSMGLSGHETFHLVNPRPSGWNSVFEMFGKDLDVPLVDFVDWVERLKESSLGEDELPSKKLISFFERVLKAYPNTEKNPVAARNETGQVPAEESLGIKSLDLTKALKSSPSLRQVEQIKEEDLKKWLRYWESKDLI